MLPPYQTILCATDCSPTADRTLSVATALAGPSGTVHVVTVLEGGPLDATLFASEERLAPAAVAAAATAQEQRAREHLDALRAGRGVREGVRVEVHVRHGWDPVQAIEALAHEVAADLVVIGTHGRAGFGRLLLGSVATELLRRRNVPVLLLNEARAEAAHARGRGAPTRR